MVGMIGDIDVRYVNYTIVASGVMDVLGVMYVSDFFGGMYVIDE